MHLRRGLIATALSAALLLSSTASWAFVTIGVSIHIAPPALPVYTQPPVPAPGFLWVPGYWAWSDDGYYWVPGTWVEPPSAGLLWTPGYWGWSNGLYVWNPGYWGPTVGFYGGINYGFGYTGAGYWGGHWQNGAFFYNRAFNNIHGGVHITNVYNRTVVIDRVNHVSFNGGAGGIQARPTPQQMAAVHAPHVAAVAAQEHQEQLAAHNPQLRANLNHGHPAIAATARPGEFTGRGAVAPRPQGAAGGAHASGGATPAGSPGQAPQAHALSEQHTGNAAQFRSIPERHGPTPGTPGGAAGNEAHAHAAPRTQHAPAAHHPAPHPNEHPQGHR